VRIASIHAHPDDAEILAGGTLAQLAALGHEIAIVTMTPGDCGSTEHPAEEIARIRRAEASTAAAVIGASYHCAEFRDLAVFSDDISRRRVTEMLRTLKPDVVLTSSPVDYHCDHEATSALVRDACFGASAPNYVTGAAPPLPGIPHLYFMDPTLGTGLADFYVDVSATFHLKKAMLACHASQRSWLRKQHSIDDYLESMERWTRSVGKRAGCDFAEGFRHYKGHPFPQTPVLEEIVRKP
jgi:LmbE family N-acetylglucosaminyl deacetylase